MNEHTATDPNGQIHTRSSKTRTYSHCVVARLDRAACEAQLISSAESTARTNYEYHCGKGRANAYTDWQGNPQAHTTHGKDYTSGAEFAADYPTLQDDINYEVARAQKIIDTRSASYYDTYYPVSWNGRLDLAQKSASKEASYSHIRDTKVLEATVK